MTQDPEGHVPFFWGVQLVVTVYTNSVVILIIALCVITVYVFFFRPVETHNPGKAAGTEEHLKILLNRLSGRF